jgi:hypothetical protein
MPGRAYMSSPDEATWRSGYATVCKTVYTSSILVVASNKIRGLAVGPKVTATGLPPLMVALLAQRFLFRTPNLGERRLHDLGGARVGVGEHVAVDVQRDRGGGVPDPAADGQDVEAGRDQLRDMGVP